MLQQNNQQIWHKIGMGQAEAMEYSQRLCTAGSWIYLCETGEYWLSQELYRIFQLEEDAAVTSKLFLSLIHPNDLPGVKEAFQLLLKERKSYHLVHRIIVNKDIKWLEVFAEFAIAPETKQTYIIGMMRDISALKQQQDKLEKNRLAFSAITHYLAQMTDSNDWQSIINQADETIQQVLPVVTSAIFMLQDDCMVPIFPSYARQLETELKQSAENFLAFQALQTGEVQTCSITHCLNTKLIQHMCSQEIEGVIAIPIKNYDEIIAVLSLFTRKRTWLTENEWEFCQTICSHLSIQLKNVLLYANLKRELYDKIAAQEDLNTIFNESLDFIVIIDAQGRLKKFNPSFMKKLGYTFHELLHIPILNLLHPEDRCYASYVLNNLSHTDSIRGLYQRFLCKNGDIIFLEVNAQYIIGSSNILAIARDITLSLIHI